MKTPLSVPLLGLMGAAIMAAGPAAAAPPVRAADHFLRLALLKVQIRIDRIGTDIEKAQGDLRTNARVIEEAEEKLRVARETRGNRAASLVPVTDLQKARNDRRRIKRTLAGFEEDRSRAESAYAFVRAALAAPDGPGPAGRPIGLIVAYSGRPAIQRADGKTISATGDRPAFLGSGDAIAAEGEDRSEILFLAGRGLVQMEGRSRVEIREPSPGEQVLELVRGRIRIVVERPVELELALRDRLAGPDDELTGLIGDLRGLDGAEFARLFGTDLEIKVPGAVCVTGGADLSAQIEPDGTTEIRVHDGSVEVRKLAGGAGMTIDRGSGVVVTKEGLSPLRSPKR